MSILKHTPPDVLSKILNIAIATSDLDNIKLPSGKEIRSQIHILIHGRIGSGKSGILSDVEKVTKKRKIFGLTRATLVGTVDKTTASFQIPMVWDAVNSCLLIDEFHVDVKGQTRDMLNFLLPLVETDPGYRKPSGFKCNDFKERRKGGLYCIVKKNVIECKTRFVFIANTMMDLKQTKIYELKALMTRCVLIPFNPLRSELIDILNGKTPYKYKKIIPKKNKITKKVQEKLLKLIENGYVPNENYLRVFGDLCRFYHVVGWDERLFTTVISLCT